MSNKWIAPALAVGGALLLLSKAKAALPEEPLAGKLWEGYIWFEGLESWEWVTPGMEIPLGNEIYLAPRWNNRSQIPITGHVDVVVTYPDGSTVTPIATEGQDSTFEPGEGKGGVQFEPFITSQEGVYSITLTLSTNGQVLDSIAFNLIGVGGEPEPDDYQAFLSAQVPSAQKAIIEANTHESIKHLIFPIVNQIADRPYAPQQEIVDSLASIGTGLRALNDWSKGDIHALALDLAMGYPYRDILGYQTPYANIHTWSDFEDYIREAPGRLEQFEYLGGDFQDWIKYNIMLRFGPIYPEGYFTGDEFRQILAAYGIDIDDWILSGTVRLQMMLVGWIWQEQFQVQQWQSHIDSGNCNGAYNIYYTMEFCISHLQEHQDRLVDLESRLAAAQRGEPYKNWW